MKEPIWNERFKGNIAMWKEDDSNPGRMLEGAQYEVRDKDGLLYCTMVTDKDGYALSIDLPVGTYYVREVVPPAGFILSDEVIEVKITTDDKNTIVFERENTPNHVVLKKTDLTTGKPVPDAMIVITNEKGDVIFEGETDLNGEIILYELPAGKYTYKETVAADGYAINDETFPMVMDLLSAAEVHEEDEEFTSILDDMFSRLAMEEPDNLAVKQYSIFKLAAGAIS